MTLDEIKKIIEDGKGRIIVVENGKPAMVIMNFEDFKNSKKNCPVSFASFPNLKKELPKELEEEELKIEDLPF
jgi:hypothetical protein